MIQLEVHIKTVIDKSYCSMEKWSSSTLLTYLFFMYKKFKIQNLNTQEHVLSFFIFVKVKQDTKKLDSSDISINKFKLLHFLHCTLMNDTEIICTNT